MERPSYDELISAYFDDETTPEENVVVERLLADPKYRQELEDYRQLRDELRSMPAPRLDSDWGARLKQRLVTAKPDWASKHDAAPAPAASSHESSSVREERGGPMPASLDASRGDGYARFRQLWLTAGVGVAAGTLGIVIGWSAQNLSSGEVAYRDASVSTSSPAPANEPLPMAIEAGNGQGQEIRRSKTESEFAAGNEPFDVAQPDAATRDFAAASAGDAASEGAMPLGGAATGDEAAAWSDPAAMFGSGSGEGARAANVPQMSRSEAAPAAESSPLGAESLVAGDAAELKKSEKQNNVWGAAPPEVQLSMGTSSVNGSSEAEERSRESADDPGDTTYYATYFGVWDSTSDDLASAPVRGLTRQMGSAANPARWNAALADLSIMSDETLPAEDAPALVLEGSPERVAEALEVLSRDRSSGEVRLVTRAADRDARAYYERGRRLDKAKSRVEAQLAASESLSERRVERTLDVKGDAENEVLSAADDEALESPIAGMKEVASSSAIDRIEAFFDERAKDKSSVAGAASSGEALANNFTYGGGFGGGVSGAAGMGGFGGIGGATLPSASASGPEPAPMPAFADFAAAAPDADALSAPAERPSAQRGIAPMAAAPAASPAAVAEVERAPGAIPSGGPAGAAPTSGADRPRSQAAGIAGATPPPAPAIAREPAPPASAPALQFAENDIPPPPAEAAAPSDESNAERAGGSVGKSNRYVEGAGSGASSMKLARGASAEGEADATAPPADQPAPTASPAAGGRARTMNEETASLEQLQERSEASGLEDRFHAARDVSAPPPQRVRVILFASERPLRQSSASGVPAGPAAALAPATPSAPATASPAADATPAESAPGSDR